MNHSLQPVYLFADSQLLFWHSDGVPFLQVLSKAFPEKNIRAAYIGASNGDEPAFYEMFEAAMNQVDIYNCKHITAAYSAEEEQFLKTSDVILLAGGSVSQGWEVLEESGMQNAIQERREAGAVLIGISAGAIQLGLATAEEETELELLKFVPLCISVHNEQNEWKELKRLAGNPDTLYSGIGIPQGGGMIYHPDHTVEALRKPLTEISNGQQNLIFPASA
jgi:hypothetical protein